MRSKYFKSMFFILILGVITAALVDCGSKEVTSITVPAGAQDDSPLRITTTALLPSREFELTIVGPAGTVLLQTSSNLGDC